MTQEKNILNLLKISLGPKMESYFQDPLVTEIFMNDDGRIWIDTLNQGYLLTNIRLEEEVVYSVIALIANSVNQEVTYQNPIISAEMPESGFRFEGNIPGITSRSVFNIRKHSILRIDVTRLY